MFFRKSASFLLAVFLASHAVLPHTAQAGAGEGLARFYAPWLGQGSANAGDETGRIAGTGTAPDHRRAQPDNAAPAGPVMTPATTRSVMDALGMLAGAEQPSAIEKAYAARIIDELPQFGYELFAGDNTVARGDAQPDLPDYRAPMPMGAIQDDFVLSHGDRLIVTMRGQENRTRTYSIDSNGRLLIEDLPPVPAAGRTIAQVRNSIEAHVAAQPNMQVYVSLESVRQAGVLVVGNVRNPGRKNLTVFNSVLDALSAAGGIEKTGSLRQIKLVRNGRSTIIDLYGLLIYGDTAMDITLRDGDRLIVPPVGPTVAVAGSVKRPAIYEIRPALRGLQHKPQQASETLSLQDMLDLAGSVLNPGQNRYMKLGLTADGQEKVEDITDPYRPAFRDGSILMVAPSDERRAGTVELVGETRRPGLHALDKAKTLSALLGDKAIFGGDIYPLIGVIERWDAEQLTPQLLDFPPLLVAQGKFDRTLRDGDVVHLFSRAQILALQDTQDETARLIPAAAGSAAATDMIDDPVIQSFLRERAVFTRGAVRQPGAWPVAEGVSLENVIAAAGGLTLEASTQNIEVTSKLQGENGQAHGRSGTRRIAVNYVEDDPARVMIGPGDSVRVNQKFKAVTDNSVLIIGEVAHPGRYDLMPGDRLSDLILRAGGVSIDAYPPGAIFSRESERRAEEARFRAQAQDLEIKLAAAMEQKDEPDSGQIAAVQQLITQLEQAEAVGRITVEADPGILTSQPELDILLEGGDRIYIPKRPLTVRVAGEVLSPAALQFRKDKDPADYIMEAGGTTYHADRNRAFVVYPDGSAQPLTLGNWAHNPVFIPPGSTIIVPRDPKPFDFIETARDISQILSNLAITGIFIDDIRNN